MACRALLSALPERGVHRHEPQVTVGIGPRGPQHGGSAGLGVDPKLQGKVASPAPHSPASALRELRSEWTQQERSTHLPGARGHSDSQEPSQGPEDRLRSPTPRETKEEGRKDPPANRSEQWRQHPVSSDPGAHTDKTGNTSRNLSERHPTPLEREP